MSVGVVVEWRALATRRSTRSARPRAGATHVPRTARAPGGQAAWLRGGWRGRMQLSGGTCLPRSTARLLECSSDERRCGTRGAACPALALRSGSGDSIDAMGASEELLRVLSTATTGELAAWRKLMARVGPDTLAAWLSPAAMVAATLADTGVAAAMLETLRSDG